MSISIINFIDNTEQLAEISFYDKGKKVLSRRRFLYSDNKFQIILIPKLNET